MKKPLAGLLLALMLLLAVGAVFIVGGIVREGSLEGGAVPQDERKRRARRAMVIAAVLVAALLYLGKVWWGSDAMDFQRRVDFFKPPPAVLKLVDGHSLEIRVKRTDNRTERPDFRGRAYLRLSDVIPDHGHLMHIFLFRIPQLDAMWHLHPEPVAEDEFAVYLPDIPSGHYQVFADVVDPRGFPWTLVGSIDLPQIAGKALLGDDSSWSGTPLVAPAEDSTSSLIPDGGHIIWQRPPGSLKAGVPLEFTFAVQDKEGRPAQDMEPYMGMAGHAEFVRSDLSVFAHVHPAGSISMAALELAQARVPGNAASAQEPMSMPMSGTTLMPMSMPVSGPIPPEVRFPYGFPQAGDYRIFVQVKRGGRVETGVFDAHVQ